MNISPKTIFDDFQGSWNFSRDFSTGDHVIGTACFNRVEADLLHYHEQGLLIHHCGEFTIHQDYFYYYEPENNEIKVYFASEKKPGNLFYTLVFQTPAPADHLAAAGQHLCKEDTYIANYQFFTADLFYLSYTVNGPQKNYVSTTKFSKTN